MFSGARPDSEEVIKQAYPKPLGTLQSWTRPGLIDSQLQAMTTQSKMLELLEFWTQNRVHIQDMKKASGYRKQYKKLFLQQQQNRRTPWDFSYSTLLQSSDFKVEVWGGGGGGQVSFYSKMNIYVGKKIPVKTKTTVHS